MGLLDRFKKKEEPFPFEDAPNTACIICRHVLEEGADILYVSHDEEDGMWQFLCGGSHEMEDAKLVSLYSVFMGDTTIGKLANMPCGYVAERVSVAAEWVIHKENQ